MHDPYTAHARLCDDAGLVSHERRTRPDGIEVAPDESYLDFLNYLRRLGGHAPYNGEPFTCTGNAHLAGEHIHCNSPAHAAPTPAVQNVLSVPIEHVYTTPCVVPISVTAAAPSPGPNAETTWGTW